jgi:hypothetical protein
MSIALRVMLIVLSVGSLFYIVRKIRFSKMQIEYALFWIVLSIIMIVMAVFPPVVYFVCGLFGILSPVNLVYLFIIGVLLLKVFMTTIEISNLEHKVKEMAQAVGINEKERLDADRNLKEEMNGK